MPDLNDLKDEDLSQPPTYVPNRNMMLLSIAAAYAESHGFRDVYYGAQAHDEYGYWDCTSDFLDRINAVLTPRSSDSRSTSWCPWERILGWTFPGHGVAIADRKPPAGPVPPALSVGRPFKKPASGTPWSTRKPDAFTPMRLVCPAAMR